MTVGTSMVGLIPIMWATGTGSDVMKPLTAPMIGGLLTHRYSHTCCYANSFCYNERTRSEKGKLEISKMADWMKEGE